MALEWTLEGRRKPRRLKTTWGHGIKRAMRNLWHDRHNWRQNLEIGQRRRMLYEPIHIGIFSLFCCHCVILLENLKSHNFVLV